MTAIRLVLLLWAASRTAASMKCPQPKLSLQKREFALLSSISSEICAPSTESSPHIALTAVPPSANPSSKQNEQFLNEVRTKLHLSDAHVRQHAGRIFFKIPLWKVREKKVPPLDEWSKLLRSGVRSVRVVASDAPVCLGEVDDMAQLIMKQTNWTTAMQHWYAFGNNLPSHNNCSRPTVHVRCKRCHDGNSFPSGVALSFSRAFALALDNQMGWMPTTKRRKAELEINILLHADLSCSSKVKGTDTPAGASTTTSGSVLVNMATVELVALLPPPAYRLQDLPHPGFKRVECWVVAKCASIQPHEVVLDPMCGRATFLVEAALFYPHAGRYVGLDTCEEQLDHARINVEAMGLKNKVDLIQGDAQDLQNALSNSFDWDLGEMKVDKILCCPPFGRQFGSLKDNAALYRVVLQQCASLLKEEGKMVWVVDEENLDTLIRALELARCHVRALRGFQLGKLDAVIVIVQKCHSEERATICGEKNGRSDFRQPLPRRDVFDWEKQTRFPNAKNRALWTLLRASSFPTLAPACSGASADCCNLLR